MVRSKKKFVPEGICAVRLRLLQGTTEVNPVTGCPVQKFTGLPVCPKTLTTQTLTDREEIGEKIAE